MTPPEQAGSPLNLFGNDPGFDLDQVVDEVHVQVAEKFARSVENVPLGAVEREHCLGGETSLVCLAGNRFEDDRADPVLHAQLSLDPEVRRSRGGAFDVLDALQPDPCLGKHLGIKKIMTSQVTDEHVVKRIAFEVLAGDRVHVENELAAGQCAVFEIEMSRFESKRPAVTA